jgi:RiboL-PSP-HEPN
MSERGSIRQQRFSLREARTMPTYSIIDRLYEENRTLLQYLEAQREPSLRSNVDAQFRKVLLLAIASHFEHQITQLLITCFANKTANDALLVSFLKKKAIERQYHTFFDWRGKNANQFLGLFGEEFKERLSREIKASDELSTAVKAFLELGDARNELVHLNFAIYPLEKTSEDIYNRYREAVRFIEYLTQHLNPNAADAHAATAGEP